MRFLLHLLTVCTIMTIAMPATADGFAHVGTSSFVWEGIFAGGRLAALGGSDLADGSPAALLINSAPLSQGNGFQLGFDRANYFSDFNFTTLSGAIEWNSWRLNIASQDFSADDVPIRTAYSPEGTGETFDSLNRMTVMGVSYDMGRGLLENPNLQWSVGAAWRHFYQKMLDDSASADTFDLGSTLGWTIKYGGGYTAITGAVSWQNPGNATLTFEERESFLPGPLRAGLTMETAFDWKGHPGHIVKILIAYAHAYQVGDNYSDSADHTGVETVFFNTLALRWGHSTKVVGDISSWGVGLILDWERLGPFTVHADMGGMGYNNMVITETKTIWGLRVGYNY